MKYSRLAECTQRCWDRKKYRRSMIAHDDVIIQPVGWTFPVPFDWINWIFTEEEMHPPFSSPVIQLNQLWSVSRSYGKLLVRSVHLPLL